MTVRELPSVPALGPLYRAVVTRPRRRPAPLSAPTVVVRGVRADVDRLAGYDRVCGYPLRDLLPPAYPHVLAFPLAMALMTDPGFPMPVLGMVHLAQRLEVLRPLEVGAPLDLRVSAENLREHPRGIQIDVLVAASVGAEVVWRGCSTYLRRVPGTGAPRGNHGSRDVVPAGAQPSAAGPAEPQPTTAEPAEPAEPTEPTETQPATARPTGAEAAAPDAQTTGAWHVGRDVGPAYAAVSGDRNPIHTSRLLARAFGFRRPIAHGMWTLARSLAALERQLPEAYTVQVTFRAPLMLPARVDFVSGRHDDDIWFEVRGSRQHMSGTVTHPPG